MENNNTSSELRDKIGEIFHDYLENYGVNQEVGSKFALTASHLSTLAAQEFEQSNRKAVLEVLDRIENVNKPYWVHSTDKKEDGKIHPEHSFVEEEINAIRKELEDNRPGA